MLATTAARSQGSPKTHREFERQAEDRLEWFASIPDLIARRLRELDEDGDIERAIAANAATLALTGTALSMTHDRRWAYLPLVVTAFCCNTPRKAGARRFRYCGRSAFGHRVRSSASATR